MQLDLLIWPAFVVFVLALLALDLGVFHRKAHEPSVAEALAWSAFWVCLALGFNALVFFLYENNWIGVGLAFPVDVSGRQAAVEFFTGYVLEKSLSLDNIFVIALIFSYFKVPLAYQHRVLFWGVVGALVLRGVMIAAGATLLKNFSWMTYVFGGLLLVSAARMLVARHDNLDADNIVIRTAKRWVPVTDDFHGTRFFVIENGVRVATPLLLVLLMVETTDVLFAVDSIPAIFAVTNQPFIVYTSNIFALLGLRSLYFALAPLLQKFRYLKASLVFLLAYVGVKMLLAHTHPIPPAVSLAMIGGILGVGILASIIGADRDTAPLAAPFSAQQLARTTVAHARKGVVLIFGGTVLVIGLTMVVLPGPALVFIPAGLVILGTQFVWARRLLARVRREMGVGVERVKSDLHKLRHGKDGGG